MDINIINSSSYLSLVESGARNLALDYERINALNVFPVPDGDTGSNMKMTIEGGIKSFKDINSLSLGEVSKQIARSMVLSARGNSGVILSQFFKGVSLGLESLDTANVIDFAKAMVEGTKKAYSVVSNPTEGTVLTVMREAGEKAISLINEENTLVDYFTYYIKEAHESLARTPDLLPVLKKAGVIDSGGAGFILVVEGMLKALKGITIEKGSSSVSSNSIDTSSFNADSELTYGYCTEFILQLQNSKVDPATFDLNIINRFLKEHGNSIVSFKDEDIVKVHVHTFDPGLVLTECRKYGEFLTLKIENMNVQHSETELVGSEQEEIEIEYKKYATVVVANGSGLVETFKEASVDQVVSGGQTMNTSTEDFINAFEHINADYILVYPNNSNIKMAAKMAADNYDKAKVIVIPTRTIAEGYSCISMLDTSCDDIDTIVEEQKSVLENVSTIEVTYSIRDCLINNLQIEKGNYIVLYNDELISTNKNRVESIKDAIRKIEDFSEKQVLTLIYGKNVNKDEIEEITSFVQSINRYCEVYPIKGNQDIYSYIIGLE